MPRLALALSMLLLANAAGFAHYNMLLPDKPWAKKDEKITFTYQFGHPYERDLSDAPKPAAIYLITPDGKRETLDIDKTFRAIKIDGDDGKKVTTWQFDHTPVQRGDHTFVLDTARIKHDGDTFIEDRVKVVLHVQTQNGWNAPGFGFDIIPYTRPYGLLPGMVFKGRLATAPFVVPKNKKIPRPPVPSPLDFDGTTVEIEKYNPQPPKKLPPDELITYQTKADSQGFFVTTLPEPGWWGITGVRPSPQLKTIYRTTLWVHVDEKK